MLGIFHRNRGEESKIHMEPQRIPNNQSNLEHKRTKLFLAEKKKKKNKTEDITCPDFKIFYKVTVIKTV